MSTKRSKVPRDRMGRPPAPLPPNLKVARPYLRLSEEDWSFLAAAAKRARRDLSAEVAVALGVYLDAHPRPPAPPEVDPEHERRRIRLPPDLVRRLDDRAGIDDRERHLVAAVRWWLEG